MGTRCRIGRLLANGLVESVYCHWDGYPDGVGLLLKEHYNTPELVEQIMAGGDMSCLGERYPTPAEYGDRFADEMEMSKFFNDNNLTLTYGTWRQEVVPSCKEKEERYYPKWENDGTQFHYLWTGKSWKVSSGVYDEGEWL